LALIEEPLPKMMPAGLMINTRPLAFSTPSNCVGTPPELIRFSTAELLLRLPFLNWLKVTLWLEVVLKLFQLIIAPWFVFMTVLLPHEELITPVELITSTASKANKDGNEVFKIRLYIKK
jgi:hypothetical protein